MPGPFTILCFQSNGQLRDTPTTASSLAVDTLVEHVFLSLFSTSNWLNFSCHFDMESFARAFAYQLSNRSVVSTQKNFLPSITLYSENHHLSNFRNKWPLCR